jgi:sugar/nucleoside kinase (ribokinase family)
MTADLSVPQQRVIVAGHICLDIIPEFPKHTAQLSEVMRPGSLIEIGPALTATGGAVSNTGLALHRLGVNTQLMGLVGRDLFGGAILEVLRGYDTSLAAGMLVDENVHTSYTVVINPPDTDRVFLHAPAANDHFTADHIRYEDLAGAALFHFGYPPIMRQFYAEPGRELACLFEQAKARGVITSLDMALPDPNAPAGQADWSGILERALPNVDLFLPSIEEILFMIDRARFDALAATGDVLAACDAAVLDEISQRLIEMGCALVGLKLGHRGLYVRTSPDARRLEPLRRLLPETFEAWLNRREIVPCFQVQVVGTTGCGDCTIAGFLAGLVHGLPLEQAMQSAVGTGAATAEQADATSGVPRWDELQSRLAAGWAHHPVEFT